MKFSVFILFFFFQLLNASDTIVVEQKNEIIRDPEVIKSIQYIGLDSLKKVWKTKILSGQKQASDSIQNLIETNFKSETLDRDIEYQVNAMYALFVLEEDYENSIAKSIKVESLLTPNEPDYNKFLRNVKTIQSRSYYKLNQYEKAFEAGLVNLTLAKKLDNPQTLINAHFFLGDYADALKKHKVAVDYYSESLLLARQTNNIDYQRGVLMNIGIAFARLAKQTSNNAYLDSTRYYFDTYKKTLSLEDSTSVSDFHINMAAFYSEIKEYDTAEEHLKTAEAFFVPKTFNDWKLLYTNRIEIYEKLGKLDSMKQTTYQYVEITDSIYNKKLNIELDELRFALEEECILREEKQEEEKATLEAQMQAKNNAYLASIFGIILAISLFTFLVYQRYIKRKKEAELYALHQQLLRTQMSPHFTFNTLANIKALINQKENKTASKYLNKFSNLLRISLDNSVDNAVSLEKEIEAIQLYLELQKIRFDDSFDYTLNVNVDQVDDYIIPTMLIQPFVENCFKHAFKGIDYKGKIEIDIKKEDQELICSIKDNGIGLEKKPEKKKSSPSLSYAITNRRLQLLETQFETKGQLALASNTEKGVTVRIHIPYRFE